MENTERLDDFRACFDDSPQPSCIIEMLKDDHGNFADFRFVYLNRALARLEGFDAEYVNGKCFYKLFDNADRKWLDFYGRAASAGAGISIVDYSPEIDKYLCVFSYRLAEGYCACLLSDVTAERKRERFGKERPLARSKRQKADAAVRNANLRMTGLKEMERRFEEEKRFQDTAESKNALTRARANITKDIIEVYRAGPNIGVCHEGMPFSRAVSALSATAIRDEKRKEILDTFSLENLSAPISLEETPATLEYLRGTNDGGVIWARTSAKRFLHPETRDIMCFLYTYDISKEKNPEMITKRITEIEYDRIVLIDVSTGAMTIYQSLEDSCPDASNYRNGLNTILGGYVLDEELPEAVRVMKLDNILRELERQELFSCSFNVQDKRGGKARKKWQFCYLDDIRRFILATKSDVTEIFNEQARQQEMLREALAQAKQASLAKSEFLSRMSHEIRTPMNAIIGMSAIAAQCVDDPEQVSDCLAKVGISARFLLILINDILDMSRIESGKVVIKKEKIPFEEFINGINTICCEQAEAKGVDYDCVMMTFTESGYLGDPIKLQQILINIISNAIKFTPAGGRVRFAVSQDRISAGKAYMRFSVNDTGIGIKEEFITKIFDPFEQEYSGASSAYGGTGLGLAISRNLAELMGGRITVSSIEGAGSEFVITLPLELCEERPCRGEKKYAGAREPKIKYDFSGRRVLLAEDHLLNVEVARRLLTSVGLEVEVAENGLAAIEAFVANPDHYYDLILMDIRMPLMDGLTAARSIRHTEKADARSIPIVAMSANAFDEDVEKSKSAGMNEHLAKPIDPKLLCDTLARYLKMP